MKRLLCFLFGHHTTPGHNGRGLFCRRCRSTVAAKAPPEDNSRRDLGAL